MQVFRYLCPSCERLSFHRFSSIITKSEDVILTQLENELVDESNKPSATELLWKGERERFNKTYDKRKVHVTSLNPYSEQRSIVKLSLPQNGKFFHKKCLKDM